MKDLSCKYNHILMDYGTRYVKERHIGEMIYAYREKHNLSRREFARLAEGMSGRYNIRVTEADISRYEKQICCPKTDKLAAINKLMYGGKKARKYNPDDGKIGDYPKLCGYVAKKW